MLLNWLRSEKFFSSFPFPSLKAQAYASTYNKNPSADGKAYLLRTGLENLNSNKKLCICEQ